MNSYKRQGIIFNIQHFSIHDGPGIRTIVFLKGCPLRCAWCANPESQKYMPELAWTPAKCMGCGQCITACPKKALYFDASREIKVNREVCGLCFTCTKVCPSLALHRIGEEKGIREILEEVEADEAFYENSGGLTLSGGEPLMQGEFAVNLLKEAVRRRIHCGIETTGGISWEILKEACTYLDFVLYDIKSMDEGKHKAFTGVSNNKILENFSRMYETFPELSITVRTPVIPGFNDTSEEILAILDFVKQFKGVSYELLPYHKFGEGKYLSLGREYPLGDKKLDEKWFEEIKALAAAGISPPGHKDLQ